MRLFPQNLWVLNKNPIVLGKHSGRHAFRTRLVELGFTLEDTEANVLFEKFKDLADKKKTLPMMIYWH